MGANTSSPKERLSLSDLRARKSRTPNCKVSPFIVEMKKENQWKFQLNALKDTNKLLVIEFTAKWCGPCKFLEPKLEDLAAKYTDVEFVKIDVDVIMVILINCLFLSISQSLKNITKIFQQNFFALSYK
ncbi:thioredoxin H8 [Brassica napus]|uniref:thioredoxin H8 n=1 Tax=Brassica napus TaxID=3708 RepID=UPI002078845C|nr:thioredoxin H8 [Brassica napus]